MCITPFNYAMMQHSGTLCNELFILRYRLGTVYKLLYQNKYLSLIFVPGESIGVLTSLRVEQSYTLLFSNSRRES